ncbi:MAG: 16S rRNA methyltransferase [Treponema sp.]|nr:MAG: 16S rRNA methyltransferase [Treponema sp.]
MKQFIVSNIDIDNNNRRKITVRGKDYNYLITVRRSRLGDVLNIASNAKAQTNVKAKITEIDKSAKTVTLTVIENTTIETCEHKNSSPKLPCIILLQWLIKGTKTDAVIRQATETGVSYIIPVYGEFSVVKNENSIKLERRSRIVREARQQSGSSVDTKVLPATSLQIALTKIEEIIQEKPAIKIMFTEKDVKQKSLHQIIAKTGDIVIMAIGAEGGISENEENLLKTNGFIACHFNTNVLRAETAALYGIAALQTLLTEEKTWQLKE